MADDTTAAALGEQMNAAETEAKPYMGTSDTDAPDTAADDQVAAGGTDPDRDPAAADRAVEGDPAHAGTPGGAVPGIAAAGALRRG